MEDTIPCLVSFPNLKPEFEKYQKIPLTSVEFTLGRGLTNSVVIPFLSISRNHCVFKKDENDCWIIEDNSTFGILINGQRLGKGNSKKLMDKDVIKLEPSGEFVYKFISSSEFEIPRKRIKIEKFESNAITNKNQDHSECNEFINNVKIKFEESQNCEIKHIEEKIQNAKQMQTTSMILKQQLQLDMNRKIQQLESEYAAQIENLKGEKNEVEKQKAERIAERDAQLTAVKQEMEQKIEELMDQIKKHNESESELLKENGVLKEKLLKEREEFLSELNKKNSSKEEMLEKLEAKMREQEEVRIREKQELEDMLRQETEQLRLAKEKELKELEEQKKQREIELEQELDNIRKNLEEKVQQTELEKCKTEQLLNERVEQMQKLSDEEKIKMEQLVQEREQIEKKLAEAQISSEKTLEELRSRVTQRETELAALAAERIQKQAEQSSEVINTLQEQLEKVRNQLQSVETEKNTLLECIGMAEQPVQGPSKQPTLAEVGDVMDSELQCSICAEIFISATTLNCSHTFCKYCITMWKKKKKECPNCRAPITSECRSIVIDSFIEKMQMLTEEMKLKRQELLKQRDELESQSVQRRPSAANTRGDYRDGDSFYSSDSEILEEEEGEGDYEHDYFESFWWNRRYMESPYEDSDDSGSDEESYDEDVAADAAAAPSAPVDVGGSADSASTTGAATVQPPAVRRGRRPNVPGVPGSYYGGYGRCFSCGARGHWAPGCPFR